jgi:pimeloyl-ACP methyl ester carboxylesterase
MYYEVHGDGPPLLFLQGGSGSIAERWIPFFADRFQVIAIAQVGAEVTPGRAQSWLPSGLRPVGVLLSPHRAAAKRRQASGTL